MDAIVATESAFDSPLYEQIKYNGKSHIERSEYHNGKSMMRNMYHVQEHFDKDNSDNTNNVDSLFYSRTHTVPRSDAPNYITKRPYGGICKRCGLRVCKADVDRLPKKKNGSNSLKKAKGKHFVNRKSEMEELNEMIKFDLSIYNEF